MSLIDDAQDAWDEYVNDPDNPQEMIQQDLDTYREAFIAGYLASCKDFGLALREREPRVGRHGGYYHTRPSDHESTVYIDGTKVAELLAAAGRERS